MAHEQLRTVAMVMMLAAAAPACAMAASLSTTFLAVAQDMAPPPSTTNTTTSTHLNLAECGQLCYAATLEHCLGFMWRPVTSTSQVQIPSSSTSNSSSSSSSSSNMGSEGKCELLSCLPHPASLIPFLGAHLFVVKVKGHPTPPQAFTPNLVPASYSMACTFAFRVFSSPQLGYRQADRRCAQDGARLVVFKNLEEEKIVSGAIESSEAYWIGLTDRQREGIWRWADRSKPTYTNWDKGQPNNYVRGNKDQDCVMVFKGRWNDHQCQDALHFICQITLLYP